MLYFHDVLIIPPNKRFSMFDSEALTQKFFRAVIEKRADDIINHYVPSTGLYVHVEGPRWSTTGWDKVATGWRAFTDAPLSVEHVAWVEGPHSEANDDMAWVGGIVEMTVRVGENTNKIRLRGTYVLRRSSQDGHWRIMHEHFSQPAADPYGIGDWLPAKAN